MIEIPEDIAKKALDIAAKLGPDINPEPIACALLCERYSNQKEIENWRDKWRCATFGSDAGYAIAEDCRRWTKEIVGCNATWVDDDLRVLAHLADLAVSAGLTKGLNKECQAAIAEHIRKRRGEE